MNIEVICNEKGMGKTTYVLKKYTPNMYFINDASLYDQREDTTQNLYCVVDSVDSIPEDIFKTLMNRIFSLTWKAIILVFDIDRKKLADCQNFNILWESRKIPRDFLCQNYVASDADFKYFFQHNYPNIDESQYNKILNITGKNFCNIDRLMLLNSLSSENKNLDTNNFDTRTLAKFVKEIIQKKFNDIPDAEILLQKASLIGEQFICDPLESFLGFNLESASEYIKQMNEMHGFIRACLGADSKYEFIFHDIYEGIYESIANENKKSWLKILIDYYRIQYKKIADINQKLQILIQLNNLYKLLPDMFYERKSICFLLFYLFRKNDTSQNAIKIATEIIDELNLSGSEAEIAYIENYKIKTLMQKGEYIKALPILQKNNAMENYLGSRMFVKYHYAFCLFQIGSVDLSYKITLEIVEYLKNHSGSNNQSQKLYCLTYSLLATLQNHFGIEDKGNRYYRLALNNAYKRLEDKTYYYDILKKCGMFYEYQETKLKLEKCVNFYEQNKNWDSAGEACMNLATEIMFQDYDNTKQAEYYFKKALSFFSEYENIKLVYVRNNFGIYYVIVENDIEKGLHFFYDALLVGLDDFTYMTIYLNICMCYKLLGLVDSEEYSEAYYLFKFAKKKLNKRENSTQYEDIYEKILDLLIDEYNGKNVELYCNDILKGIDESSFFTPLVKDIKNRNRHQNDSHYKKNAFFYSKMNQLHCFFAEFRFWE